MPPSKQPLLFRTRWALSYLRAPTARCCCPACSARCDCTCDKASGSMRGRRVVCRSAAPETCSATREPRGTAHERHRRARNGTRPGYCERASSMRGKLKRTCTSSIPTLPAIRERAGTFHAAEGGNYSSAAMRAPSWKIISTRRFCCRPPGLALLAIGVLSPLPIVVI